jgi:hypothetical protein
VRGDAGPSRRPGDLHLQSAMGAMPITIGAGVQHHRCEHIVHGLIGRPATSQGRQLTPGARLALSAVEAPVPDAGAKQIGGLTLRRRAPDHLQSVTRAAGH